MKGGGTEEEGLDAFGLGDADLAPKWVGPLAPEVDPDGRLAFGRRALVGEESAHDVGFGRNALPE